NARQVETGHRFHLMPSWSPDGAWVLFVAGEHYDCRPHVVKTDGTGLKKLAGRNGYRGVIDFLESSTSSTGTTSTTAVATCRSGRPTASPSSTPPRSGRTSSCSASRSTASPNS